MLGTDLAPLNFEQVGDIATEFSSLARKAIATVDTRVLHEEHAFDCPELHAAMRRKQSKIEQTFSDRTDAGLRSIINKVKKKVSIF